MKKVFVFIALYLVYNTCYSQKINNSNIVVDFETTTNDSLKKQIKNFVEKVSSIEFIEILPVCKTYTESMFVEDKVTGEWVNEIEEIEGCDYPTIIIKDSIPFKLKKERIINKRVKLKSKDCLRLYKLLYHNMDLYTEQIVGSCYNPANGIFFYDEQNTVIGFLEICFSCANYRIAGGIPEFKSFSSLQYNQLEGIFKDYGFLKK